MKIWTTENTAGYTAEELKLINETRAILLKDLASTWYADCPILLKQVDSLVENFWDEEMSKLSPEDFADRIFGSMEP